MHKALKYILCLLLPLGLSAQEHLTEPVTDTVSVLSGKVIPVNGAFVRPLQERDSVLIADQFLYGFELKHVGEGTRLVCPEWQNDKDNPIMSLSPWILDTLNVSKEKKGTPRKYDIRGSLLLTTFQEGTYKLPQIALQRLSSDGVLDTLVFEPMALEVKTMPVDTATFVPHDIKGQIRYPLTYDEVMPWILGGWLSVLLVTILVCLLIIRKGKASGENVRRDPPHIVALRKLDRYRDNKLWAPEKQKGFYSGVTDALREYMSERYGVGAMEMTTSEIFDDMKKTDAPKELLDEVRELFERADFVKFAKYYASDEDNASVLPVAVRFVTSTYQAEVEEDAASAAQEQEVNS